MKFAHVLPLLIGIIVFVALIPLITATVDHYEETTSEPKPLSIYYVATTNSTTATNFDIPDFLDYLSYWENNDMVELSITDSGGQNAITLYSDYIRWYGDVGAIEIVIGTYVFMRILHVEETDTFSFAIDPDGDHFDFDTTSGITFNALTEPH